MKSINFALLLRSVTAGILLAGCSRHPLALASTPANVAYYTCTMHPSVRSQDPDGKCPICGMDLVPVAPAAASSSAPSGDAGTAAPREFTLAPDRQQLIGVTYAAVERRPLRRTIRAAGLVAAITGQEWDYAAPADGYVHRIALAPGDRVEKGQVLLELEHPNPKSAGPYLALLSPASGVVEEVTVRQGRRVAVGDSLVKLADLSSVWVWAEVYEPDLPLLHSGAQVAISVPGTAAAPLLGRIAAVDPFLDPLKHTGRARIEVGNPQGQLRPGAFVEVALALDEGEALTVPVEAVLPTGEHNLVFVDHGAGRLEPRYIQLGEEFGERYQVIGGLQAGDRVVRSANFLVDAEAKVQGALPSQ